MTTTTSHSKHWKKLVEKDLFCSLSSVTFPAQHLTVLNDCSSSFTPRSDMVTLHKFEIELLATDGADVVLLLPYCKFDIIREGTKVEIMLITRQHVWDDTCLFLYLAIAHQSRNTLSKSSRIKCF